jgi:hypothetical protein
MHQDLLAQANQDDLKQVYQLLSDGMSVQRWKATPFDHPTLKHVDQYFERLNQRAGFLKSY